jgi:hypothetical protein
MDATSPPDWDADNVGVEFRLYKDQRKAVCWLRKHPNGLELVLKVDGELKASRVCSTQGETLDITEAWRDRLLSHGWQPSKP